MNQTQKQALKALDGMSQIVEREMLIRGLYFTEEVVNPELAKEGAICKGRQYCAIGSLWAGHGVAFKKDTHGNIELPGVEEADREEFLKNRHGLRKAYDALNEAALAYAEDECITASDFRGDYGLNTHHAAIEALFEGLDEDRLGRAELLRIIEDAKRRVKAAA